MFGLFHTACLNLVQDTSLNTFESENSDTDESDNTGSYSVHDSDTSVETESFERHYMEDLRVWSRDSRVG